VWIPPSSAVPEQNDVVREEVAVGQLTEGPQVAPR